MICRLLEDLLRRCALNFLNWVVILVESEILRDTHYHLNISTEYLVVTHSVVPRLCYEGYYHLGGNDFLSSATSGGWVRAYICSLIVLSRPQESWIECHTITIV